MSNIKINTVTSSNPMARTRFQAVPVFCRLFCVLVACAPVALAESGGLPRTVAHRGFSAAAPENTLSAYQMAVETKVRGAECDIHRTGDGVLVLSHDRGMLRTAGRDVDLTMLTFEEVRKLDVGKWKGAQFSGERIPTLEDYLRLMKESNCIPVVEIKQKGTEREIVEMIRKTDMVDRAVIVSFLKSSILEVKQSEPRLKAGLVVSRTLAGDPVEAAPRIAGPYADLAKRIGADFLSFEYHMLSKELIDLLHERGYPVWAWTVNDGESMEILLDWGVDTICSDRPDLLVETVTRYDAQKAETDRTKQVKSFPPKSPVVRKSIRCADPNCNVCLSRPGAVPPKTSDTLLPRHRPEDAPFGRPGSLTVVNPLLVSPHQSILSLRGDWEFATDPNGVGLEESWMKPGVSWPQSRSMPVPGCWEANGVGEPGMSTPWNCYWDHNARPLRHIYIGSAWYKKPVRIPENWRGNRIWLKIGAVRAQGWFWVNGRPVGKTAHYCGSFRFDITDLVKPGEEALVVGLVRNDVPSRTGQMTACHTWGGIYRDIELEATPQVHLTDVACFGQFDEQNVRLRLRLSHPEGSQGLRRTARIEVRSADPTDPVKPGEKVGSHEAGIELGPGLVTEWSGALALRDFRPWSPEHPDLYFAEVRLIDRERKNGSDTDKIVHGWIERFGIKKMEVRGERFYLNDRPYFLRGYGDDNIYPITFVTPVDRDAHRKNLKTARDSGFNYVRFHSHSEIREYYDAADELGIMAQPELPYYPHHGFHTTEGCDFDPIRDLEELIDTHGRHVCVAAYSMGNEGHLGTPLDKEIKELVRRRDPGRLVTHNDGGINTEENSDFDAGPYVTPISVWEPEKYMDKLPNKMPFILHEFSNLGLKLDPRISPKFTGAMSPPRPLDRYEKRLESLGLDRRWGDACLDAGHAMQRYYQKSGIESARLDPRCDGFSFWTLLDVIVIYGENDDFTGQGMYDPFYDVKSNGTKPEEIVKSNGPTVILLRNDRDHWILSEGETIRLPLVLSHYGDRDLENETLHWTLKADGVTLVEGRAGGIGMETGEVRRVALAEFTVPKRTSAEHVVFEARLEGLAVTNDWDFWLFPARERKTLKNVAATRDLIGPLSMRYHGISATDTPEGARADIVIGSPTHPDVRKALENGKRVLSIGKAEGAPNVRLGWWWIGDQTGTAFAHHPAFGDFPHDGHISPLWFRLIKKGVSISKDLFDRRPDYLSVGEGRDDYFLYAAQAKTSQGGKFLATHGLDLLGGTPEGDYLLDRLVEYVRSNDFDPDRECRFDRYRDEVRAQTSMSDDLNGWDRTISSSSRYTGDFYFIGRGTMRFMHFNKADEIVWETKPIPDRFEEGEKTYTLTWLYGIGFVPGRSLDLALSLDGEELIRFSADVSDKMKNVRNGDVVLKYRRKAMTHRESSGIISLTVPIERLKPGRKMTLRLACENQDYPDSWYGLLEKGPY